MMNLNASTMIYRPVKQVFDFVSVPENDFHWQYGTLAAAGLSDGDTRIGSFFRSIGHLLGHRVQGTFEVTEFEPNKKYGFRSLSGPLHSQTSYTFESASGSTKISISTQAHVVNFFQMNERFVEKRMKKQLKENLTLLKDHLETMRIPSDLEAISEFSSNRANGRWHPGGRSFAFIPADQINGEDV